jgi:hypothetical protein
MRCGALKQRPVKQLATLGTLGGQMIEVFTRNWQEDETVAQYC